MIAIRQAALVSFLAICLAPVAEADQEGPATELLPILEGSEDTRSTPFIAWFEDLGADGYVEEEYLVSGGANIYDYIDDVAQRPEVKIVEPDVPYTTRMLIRRPIEPARFNGTVLVEVLNATAGWDGDPIWQSTSEYIIRSGAIWVGLSTKPVTVDFLRDSWGRPPWPTRNAERYQSLLMPEFGQVWDILSQTGALLKAAESTENPLREFSVERLLMVGYSQSAAYQVTYINSFHEHARMPDGTAVYDGYYVSGGGARAKDVRALTPQTENLPLGDARNLIYAAAPVVRFQTQTEVVNFPSFPARQGDANYPLVRTYEMAGGSHVDSHLGFVGGQALVRDLGLPPSFCPSPVFDYNPIRIGYVQSALLKVLDDWAAHGAYPPASRFLSLVTENGSVSLARDADGNAIGGVRPPEIQVPLGTYLESNQGPGFCGLFGGFASFDEATIRERYRNHGGYINRYTRAINSSIAERFLLREDARTLRTDAAGSSIGKRDAE